MADSIRVKTRSIQDLRKWIIMEGQFSPCAAELLECLIHIDELRASQSSASGCVQTTLNMAEVFPPSDQEIEEWADQSDLIPDEVLACDEEWLRCFLPDEFYATIRSALARWGSPAALAAQPPTTRLALHPDGTPQVSIGPAVDITTVGELAALKAELMEDDYDREGEIAALILDHSYVDPERNLGRVLRECDFGATARAILARCSQPPAPAPASDGERTDPIRDALRRAEMSISGGLCYFTAEAKHAQLRDAERHLEDLRAALEAHPAPAPAAVPVAVSKALIKAECALADVAEGERWCEEGDILQWAERRCANALAAIRPVMKQHQIRTSEWPPLPAPQGGEVA